MSLEAIKDFREIQFGIEKVNSGGAGTAVTPTLQYRGLGGGEDLTQINFKEEHIGILGGVNESYNPFVLASLALESTPFSFEQAAFLMGLGMRGQMYGIQDGAGSDYIYTRDFPTTPASVEITATTISFTLATSTVADSGNGLAFIKEGDYVEVSGSTSNDGIYRVATSAGAASFTTAEALVDEAASASVTITVLVQAATCVAGNNKRQWRSSYIFLADFEITGGGGEDADAVMMSWNLFGRQWDSYPTGFANIATPAVTYAMFPKAKFYIDAIGGTMGNTEKSGTLLGFTFRVVTPIRAVFAANGQLYFAHAKRARPYEVTCDIEMLYDATTIAEIDNWKAKTKRQIEIKLEGAAFGTPGTTYSVDTCRLQMPGTWETFPSLDDVAGGDKITGTFRAQYDATPAIPPQVIIATEKANVLS